MLKLPFSHSEIVNYVVCGLPIMLAVDLAFGQPGKHLVQHSGLWQFEPLQLFVLVIAAYLIGNVNSTLAHWGMQEGVIAWLAGRPSFHLLNGNAHDWISYYRKLSDQVVEALRRHAARENGEPIDDRGVFLAAFRHARRSAGFNEQHASEYAGYMFSRNMTLSLWVAAGLLIGASDRFTGQLAALASVEPVPVLGLQMAIVEARTLGLGVLGIGTLLFLRYMIFFRSYSKHVLMHYHSMISRDDQAEPPLSTPAVPIAAARLHWAKAA